MKKTQKVIEFFQIWIDAIYKIVGVIVKLCAIGIWFLLLRIFATTGLNKLDLVGSFVAGTYLACCVGSRYLSFDYFCI